MLAQALGVPVVAVGSPDLVAFPLRHTHRRVVVALPARRREVFYARYRPVPGGLARDGDYGVATPDELAAELLAGREEVLLAGAGILAHREVFDGLDHAEIAGPDLHLPSAAALVELALARLEREEFCSPAEVTPWYLRPSDAELNAAVGSLPGAPAGPAEPAGPPGGRDGG
jgi:tRNA threonylcarbamoyladenosine biosynthesis protein TsaB